MTEEICASCHGSGTTTAMHGGLGPDDYEVEVSCPKCGGTGTLTVEFNTGEDDHGEYCATSKPPEVKHTRWADQYDFDRRDPATRLFVAASNWVDRCEAAEAEREALKAQQLELVEALNYWLPNMEPLADQHDQPSEYHKMRWHEARTLLAKHGR